MKTQHTYQRTFYVDSKKIQIKARKRSGILRGFYVWINGKRFFNDGFDKSDTDNPLKISIHTAVDRCLVRWIKG